jgi:hypothetical protein
MIRTIRDRDKFPEAVRRMGDILLSMGIVDKYDLKWAMGWAADKQRPLGEVLVELELATPDQVQAALDHQHRSNH